MTGTWRRLAVLAVSACCLLPAAAAAASACRGEGGGADDAAPGCERPGRLQLADGVSVRWAGARHASRGGVLSVDLGTVARSLGGPGSAHDGARRWLGGLAPAAVAGKSSFLAGFGVGFLTFALKKLLLPFFIGAQIVKSVLIAMFLPSLLGGLGKVVGKGVTTLASSSGSSGALGGHNGGGGDGVDDFEFKDNYDPEAAMSETSSFTYPEPAFAGVTYTADGGGALSPGTLPASSLYVSGNSASRNPSPAASSKVSYVSPANTHHYGSYYTRYSAPKQDYKVFHNIPSSSMLLTNYDPFYSPLLSRLDSVFKQLGYETEACRERLVCSMYHSPAKFAPYSNLVSAQLSRELNELRKPSSDNPEILRFFRYMKAAKDGQDGQDCLRLHPGCGSAGATATGPPLVKTFHDINKLVQARRLGAAS